MVNTGARTSPVAAWMISNIAAVCTSFSGISAACSSKVDCLSAAGHMHGLHSVAWHFCRRSICLLYGGPHLVHAGRTPAEHGHDDGHIKNVQPAQLR